MAKQIIDTFWENFNMSRCKTAMLVISVLIVLCYCLTVLFQIPSEGIKELVLIIIGIWAGKALKNKDKNMSFDEYKLIKLIRQINKEDKKL